MESSASHRQQQVDRRQCGVGPRVPEFLMRLYARVAENDETCQEVRLCHKGLGRQSYQSLLVHMANLLQVNTNVSLFFLQQTQVGTDAALAIGNMLRTNSGITTLRFHRLDATYLATVLGMSLPENLFVTSLTLFASTFGSFQAFQPLTMCLEYNRTHLTQLSLEGCHLNDECLTSLWHALSTNSVLTKLDFRDMRLTEQDVIQLCQALVDNEANCKVHTLLLDKNWMQDQGCASVCRWISSRFQATTSTTPTSVIIQELSLSYNHIGPTGILTLADTFAAREASGDGTENNNYNNIGRTGVISTLNLSGNALTTEDIVNLTHGLTSTANATTRGGVRSYNKVVVSKLAMEDCSLDDEALSSLAQSLPMMTISGLVGLNISGHVVSKTIGQAFVQALQSSCVGLLEFQVDLQDEPQKAPLDFYLRLNRAGRYLLSLSHYVEQAPPPQQQQPFPMDQGTASIQRLDAADQDVRNDSRSKSMPCSLWPLVLARLSKTETCEEAVDHRGDNGSVDPQQDVMYYMLREKVDLIQQPLLQQRQWQQTNDEDDADHRDDQDAKEGLLLEARPNPRHHKRKRSFEG